jgi:hypothetical protein
MLVAIGEWMTAEWRGTSEDMGETGDPDTLFGWDRRAQTGAIRM